MKLIQHIIAPLTVALIAAILATYILYQLIALSPDTLPMNLRAQPATYTEWLFGSHEARGVLNGDYGVSFTQNVSAYELLTERLPASLELFIPAVWLSLLFGIPLGVVLALLRRWLTDGFVRVFAWAGISATTFWLALILILTFAIQRQYFPASGRCDLSGDDCPDIAHLILPLSTLVIHWAFVIALHIRATLLPFLPDDAKGAIKGRVWLGGVLIPAVTLIPGFFAGLASTLVLVETIFAWPGIGRLLVQAASTRDLPVVIAIVVQVVLWLIAVFFIITLVNGLIGFLRAAPNQTPEQSPPQSDDLAPQPVGLSDEPAGESTSMRPMIDRIYTTLAVLALLVVTGIGLVSVTPSLMTDADPLQLDPIARMQPPGTENHPYGTDELGRDVLARLLAGGQMTLRITFEAALIALVIGAIVGFIGGVFSNSIAVLLNLPINALIVGIGLLPVLPFLLLAAGVITPDRSNLPVFIGLILWGDVAMVVRAKVAAALRGEKQWAWNWLLLPVYALAATMVIAITIESGLSFLGFGVQPPTPSLGSMMASSLNYMARADYLVVLPGLLLFAIASCLTIIASRVRDSKGFLPAPAETKMDT